MAKKIIVGMSPEFYEWLKELKELLESLDTHIHQMPQIRSTTTIVEEEGEEEDEDE